LIWKNNNFSRWTVICVLYILFIDHLLVQVVHLCLKFQGVMGISLPFNCLQGVEVVVAKHTTMAT
jgi:hypothetical protein